MLDEFDISREAVVTVATDSVLNYIYLIIFKGRMVANLKNEQQ